MGLGRLSKLVGSIITAVFVVAIIIVVRPWVFLPHSRIEISLPFAPEVDAYTSLIPIGEKIEHNASNGTPDGHPGIDFGWSQETKVLAVAEGKVTSVTKNNDGQYIVNQSLGWFYRTTYQELNSLEATIKKGKRLNKGEVIGVTGREWFMPEPPPRPGPSGQLHWDFASSSYFVDRLCPLIYFDSESRARIEAIWGRVPANNQFKLEYPEICNGVFKDKVD